VAFGRRDKDVGRLDFLIRIYEKERIGEGYPCAVNWDGITEFIPYVPSAYLDKILSNLTMDKAGAAGLIQRVLDHCQEIASALELHEDTPSVAFDGYAASDRVKLLAESKSEGKAGLIAAAVFFNGKKKRLGCLTKFKDGAANPEAAELGFWALWNWCCAVYVQNDWDHMPKMLSAMFEQILIYHQTGTVSPKILDIGKVPFQVCEMQYFQENPRAED
jgi:hypothetical protein